MSAHPLCGPVIEPFLKEASEVCAEATGGPVDLAARIRRGEETDLDSSAEAISLIVAMEMAQLRLLKDFFGVEYSQARLGFGYSLGELAALVAGGVMEMRHGLRAPLSGAKDCAAVARHSPLGGLFSRGPAFGNAALPRPCPPSHQRGTDGDGVLAGACPHQH